MKWNQFMKTFLAVLLVATLFIPVSLSDADLSKTQEGDASVQALPESDHTQECAEEETGKASTEWKKAPTGLKAAVKGGSVILSWKHANNADRYIVYEIVNGSNREIATVATKKAELTNVKPGPHEYRVAAQKQSGSKWKTGKESKAVPANVAEWAASPTKLEGAVSDITVTLSWEYGEDARSFSIYEVVKGEPQLITHVSGKKQSTFKVKDGGTHRYYVTARKKTDGEWADGVKSKTVKVTVKDYEKDGVVYALTDGHWTVKKLKDDSATSVTIPEKFFGMKVTAIGEAAFAKKTKLKHIDLPDTILEIADDAFDQCTSLKTMD